MNDTMNIWNSLWKCPDEKRDTKSYDMTIVGFSAAILSIVICLFYAGSYIQIEHAHRNLVRCEFFTRCIFNYCTLSYLYI